MAAIQVNWVRDWKLKNFSSPAKKRAFKTKARENIKAQIAELKNEGTIISNFTLTWDKERSGKKRPFLYCNITPAAQFIPGKENSEAGSGDSTVSPTRPPSP
jgi:hypothetical protein